jgi:hypothetical protein
MMVVLLDEREGDFCLRAELVSELARLGITSLGLVRDQRTVGIVLEGWSFDPASSAETATAVVAAGGRMLHPVMQMAVTTAGLVGGRHVRDLPHARS